jgi:hypothetical protein
MDCFRTFKVWRQKALLHNDLDFEYNQNKPNAIIFDNSTKGKLKYGAANLTKLNSEFIYRAIINNVAQRPF